MKDYSTEAGGSNADVIREIDRTTRLIVAQVNLIGVQRTNLEIRHEGEGYRAYVMMRYVTDESNKILLNEVRKNRQLNHKLAASKSFRELEKEVDKINSPLTEEKPISFKETFSDAVSNKPVTVNN
jgi:ABC-type enterochelin transport system ATPase subunit